MLLWLEKVFGFPALETVIVAGSGEAGAHPSGLGA